MGDLTLQEEREVMRRAREFELSALLRLLVAHGYTPERIRFQSSLDVESPRALIERVEFVADPTREVQRQILITLNIGLLSTEGLLPVYFHTWLKESDEAERLLDFLRFFDHCLLHAYAWSLTPELQLFPGLSSMRAPMTELLGLQSVSTMHWLFQSTFPELAVYVEREDYVQRREGFSAATGRARLDGTSVAGATYETQESGLEVTLVSDYEHHDHGARWFDLARNRLRANVLPLLQKARVALVVELVLPHRATASIKPGEYAWHQDPTALGYERVLGRRPDSGPWPGATRMERGRVKRWERQVGKHHWIELYRGVTGEGEAG